MTATVAAIRDRIAEIIAAFEPTSLAGDRFRESLDEGAARFIPFIEANPAGSFRRFQVRHDGDDETPEFSTADVTLQAAKFEIAIAYPHDHRCGNGAAHDRDRVIDEDWRKLYYNLYITGAGNFSGSNDCMPEHVAKRVERGDACDFLVVTLDCTFWLAMAA